MEGLAHSWNSRGDWVCPPKTIPESNAKILILLFYVLKHCFLGSFWVDRPSLSVSFRSGQLTPMSTVPDTPQSFRGGGGRYSSVISRGSVARFVKPIPAFRPNFVSDLTLQLIPIFRAANCLSFALRLIPIISTNTNTKFYWEQMSKSSSIFRPKRLDNHTLWHIEIACLSHA